jgi:hypothetical protein
MTSIIYKLICTIIIILQLRMTSLIYVNGNVGSSCILENRTITLNVCNTPPRLTLPVCVGFCPSSTRWDFNLNQFVPRTSACTVTRHRTEEFVCPDSTHTAVQIIIPLACSCDKHYCRNTHQHRSLNHISRSTN